MIHLFTYLCMSMVVAASYPKKRSRFDRIMDWIDNYVIYYAVLAALVSGILLCISLIIYAAHQIYMVFAA